MTTLYQTEKSTPVQLSMFNPETSRDSRNAISFAESRDGRELCASPDGQMIEKSGRDLARAKVSPVPANKKGSKIPVISGPISSGSSSSVALTLSLVNRLKQRLDTVGSMEYKQTWRQKTTPLGIVYWAHTASTPRISDKDFTGWPTPRAEDSESTGAHRGSPDTLNSAEKVAGWASPSSRDWKDTPGMATTGVNPDGTERSRLDQLPRQANLAGWKTPGAMSENSLRGRGTDPMKRIAQGHQVNLLDEVHLASGPTQPGTSVETVKAGASQPVLNIFFSAWLMSFPKEWTLCGLRATASLSRRKSKAVLPCSKATETPSCQS